MTRNLEWLVPADGKRLVLVLDERLGSPPVQAAVVGRDRLVVATEDGTSLSFPAADRKLAGLMRRIEGIVVSEPPEDGMARRTTELSTLTPAQSPGMR